MIHNDREKLFTGLSFAQTVCHEAAVEAGWWGENYELTENLFCFSNRLCLIYPEISEAMEGDRKNLKDDKLPHRDMREVELADALIRILDLAGAYKMDLASAVVEKMQYNADRADHKPDARNAVGGKTY